MKKYISKKIMAQQPAAFRETYMLALFMIEYITPDITQFPGLIDEALLERIETLQKTIKQGDDHDNKIRLSDDLHRDLLVNIFENPKQTLLRYHLVWSQIFPDDEDFIHLSPTRIFLMKQERYKEAFECQPISMFNEAIEEYLPPSPITADGGPVRTELICTFIDETGQRHSYLAHLKSGLVKKFNFEENAVVDITASAGRYDEVRQEILDMTFEQLQDRSLHRFGEIGQRILSLEEQVEILSYRKNSSSVQKNNRSSRI